MFPISHVFRGPLYIGPENFGLCGKGLGCRSTLKFPVEMARHEQDIVAIVTLWCKSVHMCFHLSVFVKTITVIFVNRFQNNLAQLLSLTHSHTMTPFDAPGKQAV